MQKKQLPIFIKWENTLNWILETVEKFPKSSRFTFGQRIINLSLDFMELIIEAIYTKNKYNILYKANIIIEKLRIFIRLSEKRNYISKKQYEFISSEIYEIGTMLGGWLKQQQVKNEKI